MALATPSQTTSYDQSAVYKLDLSEVLAAILMDDADLLSVLGISAEVATQTKHSWVEDSLNALTVKQSGGSQATYALGHTSGTVLILSASHAARITAGSLLKDTLSGKTEVIQVTTLSTNSATVDRGYGGTSAVTHAAAAIWDIIANPRPQGMAGPKDTSTTRALKHNYTQIYSKGVKLTGTAQSIDHAGISSELDYQLENRLRELKRELDRACIMGARAAADVVDGTYGTMAGLIEFIGFIEASGGNTNGTVETLTPSVLDAMVKQVIDDGGYPNILLIGTTQKVKVSNFDQEYRRSTLDSRRAGYTVEEFVSGLGPILRVVVDRWVPSDVALVIDTGRIKVMPLSGRSFYAEPLAKTGDSEEWQIVGEYTMEVRNAKEAHAYHFNLKQ